MTAGARARLAVAAVACALPAAPAAAQAPRPPAATTIAYAAPTLDGDTLRVGAGQPPTLLAVFATWCRECRTEFAALDTLSRRWTPRGVRVVAVSVDEGSTDGLRRWVAARRIAIPVAHDTSAVVLRTLGAVAVPTAVVVGGDGVVRWRGRGALRVGAPGLERALREASRAVAAAR